MLFKLSAVRILDIGPQPVEFPAGDLDGFDKNTVEA